MIKAFIRHGAISSKVRVLYGRRLTVEDYFELLKKRTVGEIAAFLKETDAYKEELSGIDERLVHRGQLENILHRKLFSEFDKLFHFSYGSDKELLSLMLVRYEIQQILSFLRYLKSGNTEEFIYTVPEFIMKESKLDFVRISNAKSFEEFLKLIEKTPYYKVLKNYKFENEIDSTMIDTFLYSYYYAEFFKGIRKLFNGDMGNILNRFTGSRIDLVNITRIIRLKKYYNLPPEDITPHILPFNYHLKKDKLNAMLSAKTPDDVLDIVKTTPYAKLFNEHSFPYIEEYVYEFLYKISRSVMMSGLSSINIPVAYLNLKEIEQRNLIAIIEGKRYGLAAEDIKKHLIGIS